MGFLEDNCYICPIKSQEDIVDFTCGDCDLDDFFAQDCFAYSKQLLGTTYCFKTDDPSQKVVCAFTLANSGVNVSRLPNARKKKLEANIPHVKTLKDYPAVLIARLGVSSEYRSLHIGSDVLDYIKLWYIDSSNKAACRFIVVDAYNNERTMTFYQQNGFVPVFGTEQQEKMYRQLPPDVLLRTRFMYYDLIQHVKVQ